MKYEPLKNYLSDCSSTEAVLDFDDIERIIGAKLPQSARKHPAWWSNNGQGHVNARAWLEAGFKTSKVDLNRATVVFQRASNKEDVASKKDGSILDRIRAALGGTVKIMPGVDLTTPLWEEEGGEV
jgi:hypothetical protein